ncbi:cell division suppressor protein YneA [Sporosarcina jiandibaonis]|uniref:cell division suppressor protein YneA n=1 Tax=Sporosarcina jiandibaonis TaxID=2715535 RepID=UPI001552485D|nr:LysM peptidoglycan-binding domain-containing protein [Sporosarcina jiandibaonis]
MQFIKNNSYLLLVVAVCIIFTMIGLNKAEKDVPFEKVVVAEGDTLWDYSVKYANNSVPADKWIKDIINLNNLTTTTIRVGDELKIPKNNLLNHNDITTLAGEIE